MISIIVPAYNAAHTIGEQLTALAEQNYTETWELLVCDNGSTDNTLAECRRFASRIPHLKIVDASATRGSAHARNVGARQAKYEKLAFCDADDVVDTGWVAAVSKALDQFDFIASKFELSRLNPGPIDRKMEQQFGLQPYDYPKFLPHAGGCGLGIKKSLHEKIGGFDETMRWLEDTDYCWRAQLSGHELHFADSAVIHIRLRKTKSSNFRQAFRWGEYNVYLYKKYRSKGMQELTLSQGINQWRRLFKQWRSFIRTRQRRIWLRSFYWRLGRIYGSLKYRVSAI